MILISEAYGTDALQQRPQSDPPPPIPPAEGHNTAAEVCAPTLKLGEKKGPPESPLSSIQPKPAASPLDNLAVVSTAVSPFHPCGYRGHS